jgi:hypothetical protein
VSAEVNAGKSALRANLFYLVLKLKRKEIAHRSSAADAPPRGQRLRAPAEHPNRIGIDSGNGLTVNRGY